jgi:FtsZ-interacting cell division protein YlmF
LATFNAWGPALVTSIALLLLGVMILRVTVTKPAAERQHLTPPSRDSAALRTALDFAEVINAYDVSSLSDPRVHRSQIVRLRPEKYQEGATEIPAHFLGGSTVSVDLSHLSGHNAARLVDFCSGLLCGRPGWIFRATDTVVILTPIAS